MAHRNHFELFLSYARLDTMTLNMSKLQLDVRLSWTDAERFLDYFEKIQLITVDRIETKQRNRYGYSISYKIKLTDLGKQLRDAILPTI